MSHPVTYCVLISDGQERRYYDRWVVLHRDLMYGPEAVRDWWTAGDETDDEPEDLAGVLVVDFDSRTLTWGDHSWHEQTPRVTALHARLLLQAWPDFAITGVLPGDFHHLANGQPPEHGLTELLEVRSERIADAADRDADLNEGEDDDEDFDELDDEWASDTAWVSILDDPDSVRHRRLSDLPEQIFREGPSVIDELLELPATHVPSEDCVSEGLWIDRQNKRISVWGLPSLIPLVPMLEESWSDWEVVWAEDGYEGQCRASGVPGEAMTEAELLELLLPPVLSSVRYDFGNVAALFGGALRRTAAKATGCLVVLISVPILVAGYFFENLKAAGYSIATLAVLSMAAFKLTEWKVRRNFRQKTMNSGFAEPDSSRPPVAGPQDNEARRAHIDQLLAGCGMPRLSTLTIPDPTLPGPEA